MNLKNYIIKETYESKISIIDKGKYKQYRDVT